MMLYGIGTPMRNLLAAVCVSRPHFLHASIVPIQRFIVRRRGDRAQQIRNESRIRAVYTSTDIGRSLLKSRIILSGLFISIEAKERTFRESQYVYYYRNSTIEQLKYLHNLSKQYSNTSHIIE